MNHRRSVDNCNDVKTEDSTTPRDKSNGNLKVGLTASGIEVARPFCRRGYGTWEPVVSMSRENLKRRTRESESTDARHRQEGVRFFPAFLPGLFQWEHLVGKEEKIDSLVGLTQSANGEKDEHCRTERQIVSKVSN